MSGEGTFEDGEEEFSRLWVSADLLAVGANSSLHLLGDVLRAQQGELGEEARKEGRGRQVPVLELGLIDLVGLPIQKAQQGLMDESLPDPPQVK